MKRLINIQKKLKAPKNQFNNFGKYNYRNLEDILEAVKPLLAEEGLALVIKDEIVNMGERYYVKATATLFDGDKELAVSNAYAREPLEKKGMDFSQLTGATSSYARKYCLNGLFLIDDTKDADSMNNAEQVAVDRKRPSKSFIYAKLKMVGADAEEMMSKLYNKKSYDALTDDEAFDFEKRIEETLKKNENKNI